MQPVQSAFRERALSRLSSPSTGAAGLRAHLARLPEWSNPSHRVIAVLALQTPRPQRLQTEKSQTRPSGLENETYEPAFEL